MHTHLGAAFEKHEFVISAAIVRDDGLPEGIPGLSYMDGIAFDMRVARGSPGPPDGVAISRCDDRIRAVERHGPALHGQGDDAAALVTERRDLRKQARSAASSRCSPAAATASIRSPPSS